MNSKNRRALRATTHGVCALALLVASAEASAGALRINFEDFFPFGGGENWEGALNKVVNVETDVVESDGGNFFGTDAFAGTFFAGAPTSDFLTVGTTNYDAFCVSELGAFWLTAGGCAGGAGGNPLFTVLGGDWISTAGGIASDPGKVSVAEGFVDLAPAFDPTEGLRALRIMWRGVTLEPGGDEYSFQAVLFNLGLGNFDVEFNYDSGGIYDPSGALGLTQSISNIDNPFTGSAPFGATFGPATFHFVNGVLGGTTSPPPASVPEPGTLPLLIAGFGALLWSARRRFGPSTPELLATAGPRVSS